MKKYLDNLPKDIRKLIYLARDVAVAKKVHAFLVGGFVRDLILNVPNYDLDIVIQGDGLLFASELARRLDARLITHHRFGTATLITPEKIKLDIATARIEAYPEPATLPLVRPSAIREDLARRDFTINALAIDLGADNFGKIVDFYHGRQDLKAGVIRILHDASFIDDPTRIIRAVRFEQRFKFRVQPHSLRLLKEAAKTGMLKRLSLHRLRDEIILILKEPVALKCILRLNKLVGFSFIHPKLKLKKSNLKFLEAIKKEISWFNNVSHKRREIDAWLMYFIGLLSSLNREQIHQVCKGFGLRRGEIKRINSYNRFLSHQVSRLTEKDILPSQLYRGLEPLSFEVILLIKARHRNKFLNLNIERFFKHYNGVRLYIRGGDLANLGLKPGPDYKRILNRLLYLQLEGKINSREDALAWLARLGRLKKRRQDLTVRKWLSLS